MKVKLMVENNEDLGLGDRITVHTIPGRSNTVISRLQDGRIILFDQNSQYFELLAPGQIVARARGKSMRISSGWGGVSPFKRGPGPSSIPLIQPQKTMFAE